MRPLLVCLLFFCGCKTQPFELHSTHTSPQDLATPADLQRQQCQSDCDCDWQNSFGCNNGQCIPVDRKTTCRPDMATARHCPCLGPGDCDPGAACVNGACEPLNAPACGAAGGPCCGGFCGSCIQGQCLDSICVVSPCGDCGAGRICVESFPGVAPPDGGGPTFACFDLPTGCVSQPNCACLKTVKQNLCPLVGGVDCRDQTGYIQCFYP
jgi:hypothetical protein